MSDQIHNLTAELEQLFMQNDFDGAKYALDKFFQKQNEEIKRLRSRNTLLSSQLSAALAVANKGRRYDDDYVPYAEEDYRD